MTVALCGCVGSSTLSSTVDHAVSETVSQPLVWIVMFSSPVHLIQRGIHACTVIFLLRSRAPTSELAPFVLHTIIFSLHPCVHQLKSLSFTIKIVSIIVKIHFYQSKMTRSVARRARQANGSAVTTKEEWAERRAEIESLLAEHYYGTVPPEVPPLVGAKVCHKWMS